MSFNMITKEKLKKEIDKLPKDKYDKVYKLLSLFSKQKKQKKNINIKSFDLGGYLDNKNVRKFAYGENNS